MSGPCPTHTLHVGSAQLGRVMGRSRQLRRLNEDFAYLFTFSNIPRAEILLTVSRSCFVNILLMLETEINTRFGYFSVIVKQSKTPVGATNYGFLPSQRHEVCCPQRCANGNSPTLFNRRKSCRQQLNYRCCTTTVPRCGF